MAGSHAYSRSPAIFLYFLLFSTCCEYLDLNTYLSKQASLRYAVCDPASSEAAESPPSKVSYLVDSRHFCWRFRRKRFFSARLSHTPTSISSFQLSNLFISGDVQVNPGPIKCKLCCRTIASNHRTLKCGICSCNYHIKCGEVKPKDYKKILESTRITWSCPACATTDRTLMSHLSSTAMGDSSPLGLVDLSFSAIQATEQHIEMPAIPDDLVSDLPKKGLTICHLNICHLSNKLDEIKLLLTSLASHRHGKPNLILGISESFLDDSWSSAALAVDNYNLFREDRRTGAGGGLLIFVPSHLPVKRRSDLEIEGVETIWLELQFPRSKSRLFCFVYRPPSANAAFTGLLEEMLSHSDCKNLCTVVLGDLNFDLLEMPRPSATKNYLNIFQTLGFEQLITKATRPISNSLLDHIFVSQKDFVTDSLELYRCHLVITFLFLYP